MIHIDVFPILHHSFPLCITIAQNCIFTLLHPIPIISRKHTYTLHLFFCNIFFTVPIKWMHQQPHHLIPEPSPSGVMLRVWATCPNLLVEPSMGQHQEVLHLCTQEIVRTHIYHNLWSTSPLLCAWSIRGYILNNIFILFIHTVSHVHHQRKCSRKMLINSNWTGTRIVYDRNALLLMRNSPLSKTPPVGIFIKVTSSTTQISQTNHISSLHSYHPSTSHAAPNFL
jgi:hypothetical protein